MKSRTFPLALLLATAGCNQAQPENNANDSQLASNRSAEMRSPPAAAPHPTEASPPISAPEPGSAGGSPGDRTSLPEPKGQIDPKSAEAAGQIVQHYGALIEQKRWPESWKLWSDAGAAKQFDRNWRDDSEVHLEVDKPGDMEGAAGSSYVTVPVVFYGKRTDGGGFRKKAAVILRRVNDVPGSTEAQRRWHIERIDFGQTS
jgi:hypothetical protein